MNREQKRQRKQVIEEFCKKRQTQFEESNPIENTKKPGLPKFTYIPSYDLVNEGISDEKVITSEKIKKTNKISWAFQYDDTEI